MVEYLPSMHKSLGSNPNTQKKKMNAHRFININLHLGYYIIKYILTLFFAWIFVVMGGFCWDMNYCNKIYIYISKGKIHKGIEYR